MKFAMMGQPVWHVRTAPLSLVGGLVPLIPVPPLVVTVSSLEMKYVMMETMMDVPPALGLLLAGHVTHYLAHLSVETAQSLVMRHVMMVTLIHVTGALATAC